MIGCLYSRRGRPCNCGPPCLMQNTALRQLLALPQDTPTEVVYEVLFCHAGACGTVSAATLLPRVTGVCLHRCRRPAFLRPCQRLSKLQLFLDLQYNAHAIELAAQEVDVGARNSAAFALFPTLKLPNRAPCAPPPHPPWPDHAESPASIPLWPLPPQPRWAPC